MDLILLPLNRAVLCPNCETLTNSQSARCAACGSLGLMSLARVLDREEVSIPMEVVAHA